MMLKELIQETVQTELRRLLEDMQQGFSFDEHNEWMKTSAWYRGLIASLRKCQVQADDFHSNNWGLRPGTNELVLLDLGFAE